MWEQHIYLLWCIPLFPAGLQVLSASKWHYYSDFFMSQDLCNNIYLVFSLNQFGLFRQMVENLKSGSLYKLELTGENI